MSNDYVFQLTEYLLWKSTKQKSSNIESVKQEFSPKKEEIIEGDMICRVCTNTGEIPVNNKIDNILIMSAIQTVANISINENDYYPKYVCKSCLEELKIAFHFKRKCEVSDLIFRKAMSPDTLIELPNSQPMLMHDFELILHQMKLRKQALENAAMKHESDNDNNDSLDNGELHENTSSPTRSEIHDTTEKRFTKSNIQKNDTECDNGHLDTNELTSSTNTEISKTSHRIISRVKNISRKNVKKKKAKKNVGRQVIKLHKITKICVKKNAAPTLNKKSLVKQPKDTKIRDYKCKSCDLKFDSKEKLNDHKKKNCCIYHPCPLCGKLVLNLLQHTNIVHLRANKYTCHQCGKVYYSSGALANHIQVHKETFEYSCDHCPYKGKRKSYLVCHMRVHTGEHRYLCSTCPAKFTNPSNLRKHQLMHVGKKFECSKCKKLFRQQKVMQDHYDSAHLNIRYRCSICGRDLSTRKKLLSHELRVHKREKNKLFHEVQKVIINNDNNE